MRQVWKGILEAIASEKKLLAVLIDPDNFDPETAEAFLRKIPQSTTHLFVGGSTVKPGQTEACILSLKTATSLPIIIFPGDHSQVTDAADALLFLSLLSGRNAEFLVGQQVKSISRLRSSSLEVIPTGYILVEGGKTSAVERVSKTRPLSQEQPQEIFDTALAGKLSGKKIIYLEAGSGASKAVAPSIISEVKKQIQIPLIVGGGIRSSKQLEAAFNAGADLVVVGTAFEKGQFLQFSSPARTCF